MFYHPQLLLQPHQLRQPQQAGHIPRGFMRRVYSYGVGRFLDLREAQGEAGRN